MLPLGPSPTYSITAQQPALPRPQGTPKAPPLKVTDKPRQKKKMAQMTEHFKAPEKIQLSEEEIANLSDAQFKTLIIKTLTELVEFGWKIDEKMKAILREQRKIYREPIVMGRKLGLKSMGWTRRKKETFNQNRMKKQEFKKMRRGLGTSRTSLDIPTSKL